MGSGAERNFRIGLRGNPYIRALIETIKEKQEKRLEATEMGKTRKTSPSGLVDIRDIRELKPERSVYRELCLIKVKSTPEKRQGVIAVADIFRAKIVDVNVDSLIVELTGTQSKIEAFIGLLQDYEILEIARTGIAGLGRGTEDIVYLE